MSPNFLHVGLARACILFSLIVGLAGLWRYARRQGVGGNYWGILAAGEVLYIAQAAVGGWMLLRGAAPDRTVHFLYGILLMIVMPAAYAFTRGGDSRRESLMYGLLGLFLAGVSIRAIVTAGG